MHHGTCVTHVPWCMPGSLINISFEVGGGENVPGIPSACATRSFTCLVRGPLSQEDNINYYLFSDDFQHLSLPGAYKIIDLCCTAYKFSNIKIYMHFLCLFIAVIKKVLEILPNERQWPVYFALPWLLMTWWHKKPSHQRQFSNKSVQWTPLLEWPRRTRFSIR